MSIRGRILSESKLSTYVLNQCNKENMRYFLTHSVTHGILHCIINDLYLSCLIQMNTYLCNIITKQKARYDGFDRSVGWEPTQFLVMVQTPIGQIAP